jgi:hypothetical protein
VQETLLRPLFGCLFLGSENLGLGRFPLPWWEGCCIYSTVGRFLHHLFSSWGLAFSPCAAKPLPSISCQLPVKQEFAPVIMRSRCVAGGRKCVQGAFTHSPSCWSLVPSGSAPTFPLLMVLHTVLLSLPEVQLCFESCWAGVTEPRAVKGPQPLLSPRTPL